MRIKQIQALLIMLFLASLTHGQEVVIDNAKTAIKSGSSKELSKYCNRVVELSFDGDKATYSKTQAEFVLRDFFKKYPPTDFEYIHQGASREGLRYAIGKYSFDKGSFRVYMLIKEFGQDFLIDTLDFSKD